MNSENLIEKLAEKVIKLIFNKWFFWVTLFLISIVIVAFFWGDICKLSWKLPINDSKFGNFGGFFAGVFGTCLSFITLLLLIISLRKQQIDSELDKETRKHDKIQDFIYKEIDFFNEKFNSEKIKDQLLFSNGILVKEFEKGNNTKLESIEYDIEKNEMVFKFGKNNNNPEGFRHPMNLRHFEQQIFFELVSILSDVRNNIIKTFGNESIDARFDYWNFYRLRLDKGILNHLIHCNSILYEKIHLEQYFINKEEYGKFFDEYKSFENFFSVVLEETTLPERRTSIFTKIMRLSDY